jgi:hypothetical protein
MSQADDIRKFTYVHFIMPAKQRGEKTIRIRVGDVRKKMGIRDNAAVAGALGANIFQDTYHVKRIKTEGPHQGGNTTYTFEI